MKARLPKGLFLILAVCSSIYFSHYYPLLPKVIARLWYVLLAFAAFAFIWTLRLFRRFGRATGNPSA